MSGRRSTLPSLVLCAGILLTQIAWVVVIAPFGGMDEFDHSYRATSVARGHWAPPPVQARHGHGELIPVPLDIVGAAHHACKQLPYTGHDNCSPASTANAAGEVLAASAAARYNPAYYWLVGAAARPFSGDAALYVMRATSVVLCDIFLFAAIYVAFRWSRSAWVVSGVLMCLTPMAVYSTSIVAPNGLQAAASVLMWCAGIPLAYPDPRKPNLLMALTGAGAAVSLLVHSTGLIWTTLALLSLCILMGRRQIHALVSRNRRGALVAGALFLSSAVASAVWILAQGTNDPSQDPPRYGSPTLIGLADNVLMWLFQNIASIPFRNQAAPSVVYAIGVCTFCLVIAMGWRSASRRQRLTLAAISLASLLIPLALTVMTFDRLGYAWQGRYALPLEFGLLLLASWVCDFHGGSRRLGALVLPIAAIAFIATQAVEVLHVGGLESPFWREKTPQLATGLPITLVVLGGALIVLSAFIRERQTVITVDKVVTRETAIL